MTTKVPAILTTGLLASDGIDKAICKIKTADQAHNSTVFTNVTGLSFAVVAGETWIIEASIAAAMSDHAAACEVEFNGPAVSELSITRMRLENGVLPAMPASPITGLNAAIVVASQNTHAMNLMSGRVTFTASGTFALRMRRSAAIGTATILQNSILRAWRVS